MQTESQKKIELEKGLSRILDRLRFFPDKKFLEQFPYGSKIVEEAKKFGGIEKIFDTLGRNNYFDASTVEIPSPEQQLSAVEIAIAGMEGKKRFEFSKPGTRKTIGVLSVIPTINEVLMKELGEKGKVKTLICCPTYIIPTWIREAERLLKDPNISVVTRRNRIYSIKKAAREDVDIVLLGYELSHRKTGIDVSDPEIGAEMEERYIDLLTSVYTKEKALDILRNSMGDEKFKEYARKEKSLDSLLRRIVIEEKNAEAASIATALRQQAFRAEGKPYYVIYDEIHNVIDPNSATARALGELFRSATWGALVTGTGIRNYISNIAYEFYLMGIMENPKDFTIVFRDNPKIVRTILDVYSNPIRELRDVDPEVKEPIFTNVDYELTDKEMDLYIGIINSTLFEGRERYLLLNYLLTNRKKLLPENFADSEREDSLKNKIEKFFESNPKLREYLDDTLPSKLETTIEIVRGAKKDKKKVIVACEYSTNLTTFLEEKLNDYGCVRIDQTISAQPIEIALKPLEIETLKLESLYESGQKFRSDLSLVARKKLGIKNYEIWDPSQRDLALLEFQTNPEITVLSVSYGTLREGADVQEADILVEYEATTVPSRFEQLLARIVRSGKHSQVEVCQLKAANTFEHSKYKFRDWKAYLINLVFKGEDAKPEEIEAFIEDTKPEKSAEIGSLLNLNSRGIVALMFHNLMGRGVERFVEEMSVHDNAMFLAKNYNYAWEYSYSSNCARLTRDIILGLENKIGRKLEDILDEGSGPATISRILERKTICIDVNRFQLDYGIDACEEKGNKENIYYLGSYTDLRNLIPNSQDNKVFDPKKKYENKISLEERSQDLVVCSLALDFATEEERKQYFAENKRVMKKDGYMLIIEPTSKIDQSCREQFLKDMTKIGFEIDRQLTGTYKSMKSIDIDTGEEKRNGFEAYVIVARKIDYIEPRYEEERKYFRMLEEYKIVDGDKTETDIIKKEAKLRRYECSGFLNIDTDVEPTKIKPVNGEPVHPDILEFGEVVRRTPEEELLELAVALRRLAEE